MKPYLTVALFSLLVSFTSAEDWPEFRGPSGQGHSSAQGLPLTWSPSENVVWKVSIPGVGWSSPIVIDGIIFITSAVPEGEDGPEVDRSLRTLALDAATGAILWNVEVFSQKSATAPRVHKKNSHASPTAIWEDGKVYVHFGHQGTACLNAEDGAILWKNREHQYKPVHGNGSSPIIVGDLLVFSADGGENPGIVALDKATGQTRWKTARTSDAKRKFSFSTPLAIEVEGETQIISPGSGMVAGLRPVDGSEIWRFNYDQGYSVVPRPIHAHGLIYLATGYDKPRCLAIRTGGKGDVTATHLAWEQDKYAPHNPSMVVVGDEFYMVADNGLLSCLDAKNGDVHFQERCTGPISASILHADSRLYLIDERGTCAVVEPGKALKILATNHLDERVLASPAVVDNDLIIRTEQHLYRISASR